MTPDDDLVPAMLEPAEVNPSPERMMQLGLTDDARRSYTVACDEHGPMGRDHARFAWKCTDGNCTAWLPESEAVRFASRAPADTPQPVPIIVT